MRPPPMTTNSLMGAEALAEVERPRERVLDTVLARNDILDGRMRSLSVYLGLLSFYHLAGKLKLQAGTTKRSKVKQVLCLLCKMRLWIFGLWTFKFSSFVA